MLGIIKMESTNNGNGIKKGRERFLIKLPTCLLWRGQTSEFIADPIPTHFSEFPLVILDGIEETWNELYSAIPNFEVVAFAEATPTAVSRTIYLADQRNWKTQ